MRALAAACLALLLAEPAARAEDKVEIKTIKFKDFDAAVAAHKGKIVVVDFWATFCIPCKKEFPNLVKIHNEQGSAGVVCMSVTVDDPEDSDKALKFLKQQKAAFANFLLDEPAEAYQKRFGFGAVPCVLVFGKDGKVARKFTADENEFSYKDVRKTVNELLK